MPRKSKKIPIIKPDKIPTCIESDFDSGEGMLTTVWGPGIWHFLHTISFNYPIHPTSTEKKHYRKLILNLENVLPCKYCRINFKKNIKKLPLTMNHMKSRDNFSRYMYNLHELVNHMLKKKSNLTYDDVRTRYEHFRARCATKKKAVDSKFKKTIKQREKLRKKCCKNKTNRKKEKGCTESLYGKKSKCVLKIVPQDSNCNTFQMDKQCEKKRIKIYK